MLVGRRCRSRARSSYSQLRIRRSLFGRSTFGRIYHDPMMGDPLPIISRLLNGVRQPRDWTNEIGKITERLRYDLTPTAFEHLVVALLQLQHPHEIWMQVGGASDDGADGVGIDGSSGLTTAVLQCKLYWDREDPGFRGNSGQRRYLATLSSVPAMPTTNYVLIDAAAIAKLVLKYSRRDFHKHCQCASERHRQSDPVPNLRWDKPHHRIGSRAP